MKRINSLVKIGITFIALFIIINIIIFSFVALTYSIPKLSGSDSAQTAIETILSDGVYKNECDGWTDLLIFNSVYISAKHGESPYMMALSNPVSLSSDPISQSAELLNNSGQYMYYTNYFVGITGALKVMLGFMSYQTFCEAQYMIFMFSFVGACICLYYFAGGWKATLALLVTATLGNFFRFIPCITYSVDVVISLMAMIAVCCLYFKKKFSLVPYFFFSIGILTYLMNYWSFPIYSLGLPLTLCILLSIRNGEQNPLSIFLSTLKRALCWIFGFGTEVIFRLISARVLHGSSEGLEHLTWYTQKGSMFDNGSRFDVLQRMVNKFWTPHKLVLLLIAVLIMIIFSRKEIRKIIINKEAGMMLRFILSFILIALIPFVWLFALYNHAFHGFDNYLLSMSAFPILSIFLMSRDRRL